MPVLCHLRDDGLCCTQRCTDCIQQMLIAENVPPDQARQTNDKRAFQKSFCQGHHGPLWTCFSVYLGTGFQPEYSDPPLGQTSTCPADERCKMWSELHIKKQICPSGHRAKQTTKVESAETTPQILCSQLRPGYNGDCASLRGHAGKNEINCPSKLMQFGIWFWWKK